MTTTAREKEIQDKQHQDFLFQQTCILLAPRLAHQSASPKQYVASNFKDLYEALADEYKRAYIRNA